jgi:hypothetical protein
MTRILGFLASIFFLVTLNGCYSHRVKKLNEEKARLMEEYEKINIQLDSVDKKIMKLQKRDSILMNSQLKDSLGH